MSSQTQSQTLRERTRAAVRAQISDAALRLFREHGFDAVTVDQIAAEAGISPRSFNRYFPTKEDAALGDTGSWGAILVEELAQRPDTEPVWVSLQEALSGLLGRWDFGGDQAKSNLQVLTATPSLRARNLEKHLLWTTQLTPLVAARLTGSDPCLRARAMTQAAIACFETALDAWAELDETRTPQQVLAVTFAALRPA